MGTMIIPILQMRKLKLRVLYTFLKPSQLPRNNQRTNPGQLYAPNSSEKSHIWSLLQYFACLKLHIFPIALLPGEKADPSIQLWLSTCKRAISCLSHNK